MATSSTVFKPGDTANTATLEVGKRKFKVSGSPAFVAAVRAAAEKPGDVYVRLAAALQAYNSKLMSEKQSTPLVARPGSPTIIPDSPYGNRPVIRVLTKQFDRRDGDVTASDGALVIGSFYDWILNDVQESDSEKVDVIETFGSPHLFVSGRFIRKYTFSGAVRATPVNAFADGSSGNASNLSTKQGLALTVSQFDLLRVFYNEYLRATEQAARGTYTEVIVDQQKYIGYVATMNFHRAAETEGFVPFTFTMFGIDRSSAKETEAKMLLDAFDRAKRKSRVLPASVAEATLKQAVGDLVLDLSPSTIDLGAVSPDKPAGDSTAARKPATLTATGSVQLLRVTGPTGARLVYRKGAAQTTVDNNKCILGSEQVFVEITDYFRFYQNAEGAADANGVKAAVANYTIRASNGATKVLTVRANMQGRSRVKLTSLTMSVNGEALPGALTEALTGETRRFGEIVNTKAILADNTIPLEFKFQLAYPDGSAIPAEVLARAVVKPAVPTFTCSAAVGADWLMVNDAKDNVIQMGKATNIETSISGNIISLRMTVPFVGVPSGKLLNDASYTPFTLADRFGIWVSDFVISVPDMAELTVPGAVFAVAMTAARMRAIFQPMWWKAPGASRRTGASPEAWTAEAAATFGMRVTAPSETMVGAVQAMTMELSLGDWYGGTLQVPLMGSTVRFVSKHWNPVTFEVTAEVSLLAAAVTVVLRVTVIAPQVFAGGVFKALAAPEFVRLVAPAGAPYDPPTGITK